MIILALFNERLMCKTSLSPWVNSVLFFLFSLRNVIVKEETLVFLSSSRNISRRLRERGIL